MRPTVTCPECGTLGRALRDLDGKTLRACDVHDIMWWTPQDGFVLTMPLAAKYRRPHLQRRKDS